MSPAEHFRAFVAITPDEEILNALNEKVAELRSELKIPGIRWEPLDKWHITLSFLGDVQTSELPELCEVLQLVCSRQSPFQAKVMGIGAFPSLKRARVLWAGVDAPSGRFTELQRSISESIDRFAAKPDEKRFHPHLTPHLTIARIRLENRKILAKVESAVDQLLQVEFGNWEARSVELWRSTLQPGGSKYELLKSFSFQQ